MPARVASPEFVGRESELKRIVSLALGARAPMGRCVVVAGDAGIGKTRLMQEAMTAVRTAGGIAVDGRCLEFGGAGTAFGPVRTILRELRSALGERRYRSLANEQSLAALDTTRQALAPSAGRVGVGVDSSQARLFDGVLELLSKIGTEQPLLVVVEDLHWSDPSTLDLLAFVSAAFPRAPFVVALTVRTDELHRRHPLMPFLASLERSGTAERLDIGELSETQTAAQLAAILGRAPEPELVRRVRQRSEGNPFYSEEVLAQELAGVEMPQELRNVLLVRSARLNPNAQSLLNVLAVGGNRVRRWLLQAVAEREGLPADAIEALVRELVASHIVTAAEADGHEEIAFRHALMNEAIYGELLPGERTRLHARYAEAIATIGSMDEQSSQLADHWYAAHDLPRAFSASLAAAAAADRSSAFTDALRHYERALELWDRVPVAVAASGLDRVELLERAATAAAPNDPPRAATLMVEAIAGVDADRDPTRAGLLHGRYGRYAWLAGDGYAARVACQKAVDLVPAQPSTPERARVLAGLGQILMVTGSHDALDVTTQAVEVARAVGAEDVECHALTSLGVATVYDGDLERAVELLQQSKAMAARIGSIDDETRADANLVDVLGNSGRFREAGAFADQAFETAQRYGTARVTGVLDLAEGGMALYRLGDWAGARRQLEQAWQFGMTGVAQIELEERLALVDVGQGRFEDAIRRIALVKPLTVRAVEAQLIAPLTEAMAEMALWRGRPDDAIVEIDATLERLEQSTTFMVRLAPLLALAVRAGANACLLRGVRLSPDEFESLRSKAVTKLEMLSELHADALRSLPNFVGQTEAWLNVARADLERLDGEDSGASWRRAIDSATAAEMAGLEAYAQWRLGEAALRDRQREDGREALLAARRIAVRLGAEPLLQAVDQVAKRASIRSLEAQTAVDRDGPSDDLGLTRREQEVLALVALGNSNRQIAETLFISERTAGAHLSNILGKLDVRTRTEAALVARRAGLVD